MGWEVSRREVQERDSEEILAAVVCIYAKGNLHFFLIARDLKGYCA